MSQRGDEQRPTLSIIVVSFDAAATIERCLSALVAQRSGTVEIIVVDSGTDATVRLVSEGFPEVALIRSATRRSPGAARNIGIAAARGDIVGFVDADCVAAPDWAERVLAAHQNPAPVVGGVVDLAAPSSALGTALYLCEFNQWMPGTPAGPMLDIPTCCLSLKRWAFERFGPFRAHGYCSDTAFNWKLAHAGFAPRLDPAISVAQIIHPTLPAFVRKQLMHGRAFARMRVAEQSFSPLRRCAYALLAPALPLLLALRLTRRMRQRGQRRTTLARNAPLVLLGLCLWSLGELHGYVRPD